MKAHLQRFSADESYTVDDFTVVSNRNHELKDVYTIVLKDCEQKHCAILKLNDKYQIIDMCSFNTSLKTADDDEFKRIAPLKFIDLHDADEILIGSHRFIFKIEDDVVLVPASQDMFDQPRCNFQEESQHLELPETQTLHVHDTQDMFEASEQLPMMKEECATGILNRFSDDDDSDDMRVEKNEEKENRLRVLPTQKLTAFSMVTQPFINVPRLTRHRKRKQDLLKPKTLPMHLLDATQMMVSNYNIDTMPLLIPVSQKPKRVKIERDLEFEREFTVMSQNRSIVNPILLSDDDGNEVEDISFGTFLKRKSSQVKDEQQTQMSMIEDIPEVPSQFLNDSSILMRINESQHKFNESFMIDEPKDEKFEPEKRFFGEPSRTQKRKKLLRYASSDDDDVSD